MDEYGTVSFTMLWDPSGDSWEAIDVYGQPVTILYDRRGKEIKRWFTSPDAVSDEVLSLASQST